MRFVVAAILTTIVLPACATVPVQAYRANAPPSASFPEAESLIGEAANAYVSRGLSSLKIVRTYVMDSGWDVDRAPSGGVVDRTARSVLYVQEERGDCYQRLCHLVQDDEGGTWGRPHLDCPDQLALLVTCESVEALPR